MITGQCQNIPKRNKDRPDESFRQMFEARKGRVLGTVDYSQLELCTLAATIRMMFPNITCTLGDAIDQGKDVHCITGGLISGMSYEAMLAGKKAKDEQVGNFRQGAKACIAKGSMVPTSNGWKPIERVLVTDLVWDGFSWVRHEGVVCKGKKTVQACNDILALTSDHKVFLSDTDKDNFGLLSQSELSDAERYADEHTPVRKYGGNGVFQYRKFWEEDTYDIVNAGPFHRFYAGTLILANCNFGLPGGLGGKAFVGYAEASYGVKLSLNQAWKYINAWKQAWPEVPHHYLKYSGDMTEANHGTFTSMTITGRAKAYCVYTEGSNYPFQGLAADGAKAALWAIWRECVLGGYWSTHPGMGYGSAYRDGPLRESRLVNFVHDEIVAEHPEGDAGKAALARQESLMVSEMTRICLGKITISVESKLSNAWEH